MVMSKTVNGALQGAGTGAVIGSAFSPVGTAIGAGIGAIGGGISGWMDQQAIDDSRDQALAYNQEIANAGYEAEQALNALADGMHPSDLSPYQYQVLQQYYPQVAERVLEQAPELMTAGGEGRDYMQQQAEMSQSMAMTGDSPAQKAQRELSYLQNTQAQQQMINQLQQQAHQQGNGNIDFNLAMQGGQQLSDNMSKMGLQNQASADDMRMKALQMMGSAGANLQQNDQQAQQFNKSTLNDFNKRLASMKWDYELNKQNEVNKGNQFNISNAQDVANRNIASRNQANDSVLGQQTNLRAKAIDTRLQARTGSASGAAGITGAYNANKVAQPGVMETAGSLANIYDIYKKHNPNTPKT